MEFLPTITNLKLIQNIDQFKKKYTYSGVSKFFIIGGTS